MKLKKITQILVMMAVLTPLIVYRRFYFPFITGKVLFFRTLVLAGLILAGFYFWQHKKIVYRQGKIWWCFLSLMVVSLLAAIFGVNFYNSFWSNIERADGVLFLITLFIYFSLSVWTLTEPKHFRWTFRLSIVASLGVTAYGLMQYFGVGGAVSSGDRIASLLGNAAYLGSYLLMQVFLVLYLLTVDRSLKWRIFYFITLILNVIVIFMTQTRGAILGLLGGLFLAAALSVWRLKNKKVYHVQSVKGGSAELISNGVKKISLVVLAVIILFTVFIFVFKNTPLVQNIGPLKRVAKISLSDATTVTRLAAWKTAARAFIDRPILGWGPENYNTAFSKYFPPEIYADSGSRIWFDKAHNVFFEYLVTTGILGTIVYFGLLIVLLITFWRSQRISKLQSNILIGLLFGYTFANMFVFDTISTYIIFGLLLAYAHNIADYKPSEEKQITANQVKIIGLSLVIILFLFWWYQASISATTYNYYLWRAEALARGTNNESVALAYDYYKKALANNETLTRFEIRRSFALYVLAQAKKFPDYDQVELYDLAIDEMKKSIAEAPMDIRHYYNLNQLYIASYKLDKTRLDLVIKSKDKMIALAGTRAHTFYQLGEAYFLQKDYDNALLSFQKATALNPNVPEAHANVFVVALTTGNKKLEKFEVKAINQIDPHYFDYEENILKFLPLFKSVGREDRVESDLIKLINLYGKKTNYVSSLAMFYAERGDNAKAEATISQLLGQSDELDNQVAIFIQKLHQGEFKK